MQLFLCFLHKAGCVIGKTTSQRWSLEVLSDVGKHKTCIQSKCHKKKLNKYKVGKAVFGVLYVWTLSMILKLKPEMNSSCFWSSSSNRGSVERQLEIRNGKESFDSVLVTKQKLWCLTVWLCLYLVSLEQGCALPSNLSTVRVGRASFFWLHNRFISCICNLSHGYQSTPLLTHTLKIQTLKVQVFINWNSSQHFTYQLLFSFLSVCQKAHNYIHKRCHFPAFLCKTTNTSPTE